MHLKNIHWTELWIACIISIVYNKEAKWKDKVFPCFSPLNPTLGTWPNTIQFHLNASFLLECTKALGFPLTSADGRRRAEQQSTRTPARSRLTRGTQERCLALHSPEALNLKETRIYRKFNIAETCTIWKMCSWKFCYNREGAVGIGKEGRGYSFHSTLKELYNQTLEAG